GPRALEPPTGTVSMARTPVVEIGSETRPVLARAPRRVLKVNETVRLPAATLEIPIVLGDDVARGTRFVVEGEVSVRDPEATRTKDIVRMRGAERFRVDADPLVVEAGEPGATLSFAVPDELRDEKGLLTVLARELPAEPDR